MRPTPDLIAHLARLLVQDNAVLFIGPTLGQDPERPPLLDRLAEALAARIDYQRPDRSLPAVARDFEVLLGRSALLQALAEELERLEQEPATVHQLIATALLPENTVITTRFDHLLELALQQLRKPFIPVVQDEDVPGIDATKVTLIKLLGDITRPQTLVITEDDIDAFIDRLPTVSDVVKAFFATKTLILLGYDLNGEPFKRFFRRVSRNLSVFRRTAYAVVPAPLDEVERRYWEGQNVQLLVQAPMAFLEALIAATRQWTQAPPQAMNPLQALAGDPASAPLPPAPYKGLDSYTAADAAIFAGRDQEAERLTHRILAHRLTVVYGESGSGKTSLLQAGVRPRLARRRALMALAEVIPGAPLEALLQQALQEALQEVGLNTPSTELVPQIRQLQARLDGPVVLALDQFEQLFLAEDAETREAAARFLQQLRADPALDLRLVLAIREDFLGRLETLRDHLPNLLDVRFRLERLGREAARATIEEPAQLFHVAWEPALVQRLLDELSDGDATGVAPPQLQIVCQRLYQAATETPVRPGQMATITSAHLERLGGVQGILGEYLTEAVAQFDPDQQPHVRLLLAALVHSSGVKQRLSLAELARTVDRPQPEVTALLDRLTQQRLVQRFQVGSPAGPGDGPSLAYQLAHDYLAGRILRWLGDEFWETQRAREILRQALPAWQSRARLPGPDDLRLIAEHRQALRPLPAEAAMLYAAAVVYGQPTEAWASLLRPEVQRDVLLRLVRHPEPRARQHALTALATLGPREAADLLVERALADDDGVVRSAAAQAIATLVQVYPEVGAAAVEGLAAAGPRPEARAAAMDALATVVDRAPAAGKGLPAGLRQAVRRRVWQRRWGRGRAGVLAATLRGLQGGFWGFALGLGPFLGLYGIPDLDQLDLRTVLSTAILGSVLAGVLVGIPTAGVTAGLAALERLLLDPPTHRRERWSRWLAINGAGGLAFALGFELVLFMVNFLSAPLATLVINLAGGFLLVAVLRLPDLLDVRLPRLVHLGLAALVGGLVLAGSGVAGAPGDAFAAYRAAPGTFLWLLLAGAISSAGLHWAIAPAAGRQLAADGREDTS
ncbi:nSTAND1 domain-containing NTPase [Litorilinea aerophila]|uniref:Novel STAND NTPase 1 domain-containing protein n=1 Tax=Litorilinea aerophila TaxID=1204385 RepID=A0A540VHV0_9CHLR|nr:SIR2 family protein [Litorilinea aerophila]